MSAAHDANSAAASAPEPIGASDGSAADLREVRNRAARLIRSGRLAEAEAELGKVLARDPADRVAQSLLGMARFRAGDYAGAEQAYRRVLDAAPDDADAAYALGVSLMRLGRRDDAAGAFEAALRRRPMFTEAARRLDELRAAPATSPTAPGGTAVTSARGTGAMAADTEAAAAPALAQLLDSRSATGLDDETLGGRLQWSARPFPVIVMPAVLVGAVAVAVPPVLRTITEALPDGIARHVGATLWRAANATGWPFALVSLVVGVAAWLTTRYVVREHRLEVTRGVLVRRHVVLWFHDIERQPVVQQNLAEQLLTLASVVLVTDALLLSRSSRRSRLGQLVLRGLSARQAQQFAAIVRQATLVERRRMIANFISTR